MNVGFRVSGFLLIGVLCLPLAAQADTQTTHRTHKAKKQQPPPAPLPSGTQGPVPQIPLDAIPAVAPQVSYQDGMLTIVAPNSTLGDILRGVRKHTSAEIEIPPSATERVATHLGPGPARDVVAELLNGSHFNYVLLGSPENANQLVRVVLVAKTPDTPPASTEAANGHAQPAPNPAPEPEADTADEPVEDTPEPPAEAEQQQAAPDQPGVKSPQQLLQEMQQRQLQMQQQQANQPQPGQPVYPPPGMPRPPQQPPQQPPQEQQ